VRLDGVPVPDRPGEIRACLVVRDEARRLPSTLDHHRRLGVDRFLVIDNGSIDGTVDYLVSQPDVHLFQTTESFAAANDGLHWGNAVRDAFCDGHWTLSLDADEQFVFPGYEALGLRPLCELLETHGADCVMAMLLDMYNAGDVSEAIHDPARPLIETCDWFDPGPYRLTRGGPFPGAWIHGGPRDRLIDFKPFQDGSPLLTKVPLVRWRRGMAYLLSTHQMTPATLFPVLAVLLHFKFLSDVRARVATAVEGAWHGGAERDFLAYQAHLASNQTFRLHHEGSVRYESSRQLVELGVMLTHPALEALIANQAA
jgi:glycosyltransferase involved in cell wall biosynthesis